MPTAIAKKVLRAVGYVRVSQSKAVERWGLPAQEHQVQKYSEFQGWDLIRVYREEGVTGYRRDRPALEELLAGAGAGEFDVVVFPSIDRAGRSVKDVIAIHDELRGCNVTVVYAREGVDTSTPMGRFFRTIMAAVAELEGEIIHERLESGRQRKIAEGGYGGGTVPYGWCMDRDDRRVRNPVEDALVDKMKAMHKRGMSMRGIARELNRVGTRTRRGGVWYASSVRNVLLRVNGRPAKVRAPD